MSRSPFALVSLVCLSSFTQCGCLLSHSHHKVVRQGEPLHAVTFESENARSAFEACAQSALSDETNESRSSFGIPFIVGLQRSRKVAPNAIRNDVATRLDLNGDRHITDDEASLFE